MEIIYNIDSIKKHPHPVVTLGNFDGVHDGHKKILAEVVRIAQDKKGTSVVCTYSPNTKVFFEKIKKEDLLMTEEEKYKALANLGIDLCIVFPFTDKFKNQTAVEFVQDYLVEKIGMKEFVIGYDTNFGSDRKGDKDNLKLYSKKYDFVVHEVEPLLDSSGSAVSSSSLRI